MSLAAQTMQRVTAVRTQHQKITTDADHLSAGRPVQQLPAAEFAASKIQTRSWSSTNTGEHLLVGNEKAVRAVPHTAQKEASIILWKFRQLYCVASRSQQSLLAERGRESLSFWAPVSAWFGTSSSRSWLYIYFLY